MLYLLITDPSMIDLYEVNVGKYYTWMVGHACKMGPTSYK